ncbi:MAG TPA: pyruvate dehydrogenase complex dihydrolipoamide acetyltransferase [Geminicoccaceae bacterium]
MPTPILMPALSPTMSEGNLARWLKKEGDPVSAGDIIAEIETDKATMEFEAVDEGVLGRILVGDGTEGVAVNQPIGILLEEGEDESALEGFAPAGGPAPGGGETGGSEGQAEARGAEKDASPPPAAEARPGEGGKPAGPGGAERQPKDEAVEKPAARKANGEDRGERIFASPLARRMAEMEGLDLGRLEGSGPHGRIVKRDIERALSEGTGKPAPAAAEEKAPARAAAPEAPKGAAAPALTGKPQEPHEEIQLDNMRKVIARRLTESKQTIPHFYLTIDVELDALLKLRKELNAREGADYKLSVNDFVIKAAATALKRKPEANAAWGGDRIYQFKNIDISVAVAIPRGLITPIIRNADQKGLSTISAEMKDLAGRAKEGKLKPEEFQGGGFSISNLGMYGVKDFAAVINPPQACILAVGGGEQRPVIKEGAVQIATMMSCTLSIDHRVVDGALGAQWLQVFKGLVEDPLAMLL